MSTREAEAELRSDGDDTVEAQPTLDDEAMKRMRAERRARFMVRGRPGAFSWPAEKGSEGSVLLFPVYFAPLLLLGPVIFFFMEDTYSLLGGMISLLALAASLALVVWCVWPGASVSTDDSSLLLRSGRRTHRFELSALGCSIGRWVEGSTGTWTQGSTGVIGSSLRLTHGARSVRVGARLLFMDSRVYDDEANRRNFVNLSDTAFMDLVACLHERGVAVPPPAAAEAMGSLTVENAPAFELNLGPRYNNPGWRLFVDASTMKLIDPRSGELVEESRIEDVVLARSMKTPPMNSQEWPETILEIGTPKGGYLAVATLGRPFGDEHWRVVDKYSAAEDIYLNHPSERFQCSRSAKPTHRIGPAEFTQLVRRLERAKWPTEL